jgi:hypothetical protein
MWPPRGGAPGLGSIGDLMDSSFNRVFAPDASACDG